MCSSESATGYPGNQEPAPLAAMASLDAGAREQGGAGGPGGAQQGALSAALHAKVVDD